MFAFGVCSDGSNTIYYFYPDSVIFKTDALLPHR